MPLAINELRTGATAVAQEVSAYEMAYLLLAQGEGLPLATLDKKMRKAAGDMEIRLFAV